MVLVSQRDHLGALARPSETEQAGLGEPPMHPLWGSEVEHRVPTRKAVCPSVGSECTVRHLPGSTVGQGVCKHRVLEPDPAAQWRKERGTGVWRHPRHLGTQRERKLLFF